MRRSFDEAKLCEARWVGSHSDEPLDTLECFVKLFACDFGAASDKLPSIASYH